VWRGSNEYNQRRELGCAQYFQRLGFDVQYGDLALLMNFSDRVELRAIHGVIVGAYLTIHVITLALEKYHRFTK
jgi:hypothetical protein